MTAIYDYETGAELTCGLQGSSVCDEAIHAALRIAAARATPVELHDDDGHWLVEPDGSVERLEIEPYVREDDDEPRLVIGCEACGAELAWFLAELLLAQERLEDDEHAACACDDCAAETGPWDPDELAQWIRRLRRAS